MKASFALVTVLFLGPVLLAQQPETSTPKPVDSSPVSQPTAKPLDTAASVALLHIYRHHRYEGSALAPSIYIDDVQVARVGNGRRFTAKLSPGPHTIRSDDKSSAISLDAKAGSDYYVRVDEQTGFWKGHGKLTMLMPEQGKAEYALEKPIEPDRRLAKDMIIEE